MFNEYTIAGLASCITLALILSSSTMATPSNDFPLVISQQIYLGQMTSLIARSQCQVYMKRNFSNSKTPQSNYDLYFNCPTGKFF